MRKLFLILMTLCAVSWSLSAQTRTYSGSVVDAGNNEPLIGATVMPIGGGQGTATDVDGNFTITVPAGVKSVKVSYVGYKEQTVALHDKMVVHLASSSTNLDDVVVVAYGTANKESLTGSVAVVGAKEIEDRPVTNVMTALEGSAPGVNVNSSTGYPGSSPQIRIRGFNSFNSAAQGPLYVVDGVVYNGDIADINPADVESMSVLKDAASCALYGSRGANGVVIITTKKAKGRDMLDVNLQMSWGAYGIALPLYDRLGVNDWMEQSLRGYVSGIATSTGVSYEEALAANKDKFISGYAKNVNIFGIPNEEGVIVPAGADQIFDENGRIAPGVSVLPGYNDLDWWDAITRTGFREEYNLNAAGASEKFDVFASMGYLNQSGYVIETDFRRFTGRLNANFRPVSYFKAGINLSGAYSTGSTANVSASSLNAVVNPFMTMFYAPIRSIYAHDENGNIIYENGERVYSVDGFNSKTDNVIWSTYANKINNKTVTLDGTIYGTAILPYGFELTLRGSMYRTRTDGKNYSSNLIGSQQGVGSLSEEFDRAYNYNFSQMLNWAHDYGNHHVDVVFNHENNKMSSGYSYVSLQGQKINGVYALGNFNAEEGAIALEQERGYATETYLGRARYNYDQKYFGEFSLSRDGSSQFAKDKRWGTFWSVGASWIISKEKFMAATDKWLNYLKLRFAYGTVGNNQACSYYNYLTLYDWTFNGKLVPTQLAAPDLKWESTNTLDVALEGSLFDDRFTFSIGYFDKRNADLIYSLALPSSVGNLDADGYNPSILTNIGEMKNTGWELQFGVDIIRNANLKWNFNCDFSFIKNEVVKLPYDMDIPNSSLFQGKSRYEHYRYEYAGVDMLTGRSLYKMNPDSPDFYTYNRGGSREYNQKAWESNVKAAQAAGEYVEIDGVPYTYNTTYAGRALCGTKLPTVYGSFGTNLSWKGIKFGMLFTYSIGGKVFDDNYYNLMGFNSQAPGALHKNTLNSWTQAPEGMTADSPDRLNTSAVPSFNSQYSVNNNDLNSSIFLTSASYLTLKNINLSYDLPSKWVNALKLKGINVGFQMENAFIATARKGLNPEAAIGGLVGSNGAYYMPARTYTFQLGVRF